MSSSFESLTDADLALLLNYGTATAYEAAESDCALNPSLRPVWSGAKMCGRAIPVRTHPADNLALHRAVDIAEPGDVLVVDGRSELCGYWGEVLAVAALAKGIGGLVIDGGVRDVVALQALNFPVFSVGVAVHRTGKFWPGLVGEPIEIAGVFVSHGDAVIADEDGVVVLPAEQVRPVLAASERRVAKENDWMEQLRAGVGTMQLMNLPVVGA